jgi:5'-3' exonuclease
MRRMPPKKGKNVTITPKKDNVLLVDGNALYKTGYHGAKDEYNSAGRHIGGVYQFLVMLRKFLNEDLYHKVYVFWDGDFSGKLRYELYRDYKISRGKDWVNGTKPVDDEDQILERLIVQEYLEELFIRQLEHPIVESDDFIAYYVNKRKDTENITIVTNDSDICQLINDNVRIYLCNPNKKVYVTKHNYQTYFQHHQSNSLLVKVISGDTSDDIAGVKGVKEKTLLNHFPELMERTMTLDEIIEKSKQLQEGRQKEKKKPLKALTNIIEGVTSGVQGEKLYEINQKIVDLSNPLLTEDAVEAIEELMNNPIDGEGRSIRNAMLLMKRDGIYKLIDNYTENYFMPFKKLIERERKLV